jgi:tRNA(fMet)-specific endonuclease VapC
LKRYLFDTNICIYYIKGQHNLDQQFEKIDPQNCFISEITLAELKFGVENSEKREKNLKALEKFLSGVTVIPIFHALDLYAKIPVA